MCMSIVRVVIPAGLRPQTLASSSSLRDGTAGVEREVEEERSLAIGERDPAAVVELDLVPLEVGEPAVEGESPDGERPFRGPPQDGLDPGKQLLEAERLDDIIVGPLVKPADAVVLRASCGQDDHRQRRPCRAKLAQDGHAVVTREDQVEHQQVAFRLEGRGEAFDPIAGFQRGISGEAQGVDQASPDRRVVLDDQDALGVHELTRT